MTWLLWSLVLLLLAGMWAVCETLHYLRVRCDSASDRIAWLERNFGAISDQVNNRIDLLQMELDNINGLPDDDQPFEPDTDMED